jgi:hypothetical protein
LTIFCLNIDYLSNLRIDYYRLIIDVNKIIGSGWSGKKLGGHRCQMKKRISW